VVALDGCYSWIPTLNLLARDKALASAVVQLDILGRRRGLDDVTGAILNLVAIANLTSLQCFRFTGGIFQTKVEECEFWRILASKTGIPLEQLTYQPLIVYPYRPWYGDRCGDLGGLKIVEWHTSTIGKGINHFFNS
jgi:hypothetical protein